MRLYTIQWHHESDMTNMKPIYQRLVGTRDHVSKIDQRIKQTKNWSWPAKTGQKTYMDVEEWQWYLTIYWGMAKTRNIDAKDWPRQKTIYPRLVIEIININLQDHVHVRLLKIHVIDHVLQRDETISENCIPVKQHKIGQHEQHTVIHCEMSEM